MLLHPAIAASGFAALGAATSDPVVTADLPVAAVSCPDLLQRFGQVSDGRSDPGRVHPVAPVLALCAAAVVAGMASFTAIAGWVTDVPAELLVALYGRRSDPPSLATIWRVVTGADAAVVDAVIGAWLIAQATARDSTTPDTTSDSTTSDAAVSDQDASELVAIMVDGKAVRGATDAEGNQTICSPPPPTTTPWSWARSRSARRATRSPSSPRCWTPSPPPGSTWPTR